MILTPNQVALLCWAANWLPQESSLPDSVFVKFLDTVIAIAHGESGWNTAAVNGQYVGLFQIGTETHKDRIGDRDMLLPHYNVQVARELSYESFKSGHDKFRPWEAYTKKTPGYLSGKGHGKAALKYLRSKPQSELEQEAMQLSGADPGEAVESDPLTALGGAVGNPLDSAFGFIKKAAVPVGAFLLGAILLILGAVFLITHTKAGKAVVGKTPAGIVKKVVK